MMSGGITSWRQIGFACGLMAAWGSSLTSRAAWGQFQIWGDRRDGTYQNPGVPADYSDLDCIRVEADYYAISSTLQYSLGVVILRSKDLVNWSTCGHVVDDVTQIGPEMNSPGTA